MKLKKEMTVYFYNHINETIEKGTLLSTKDQSGYDEHSTLLVQGRFSKDRVLEDWVFDSERKAKLFLKKKIRRKMDDHRNEIKRLRNML